MAGCENGLVRSLEVRLPDWVAELLSGAERYPDDAARMGLAVALADRNVTEGGGPFGAAIFDHTSGRPVGVGMNLVLPAGNSTLHAEMVAIMAAEAAVGSHTLAQAGRYELFTSCAPCAMCLGGILWSGVERLVCAADAEDARRIGFDEGPVFEESYRYLEERGIEVVRGFMREAGRAVLERYAALGGRIYNGR
ncbi:nucleoside deaminase [Trichlorobacter ammonificans]|uniref:Cytosine/adenosine deaminase n=1 Tax=Trichlorobacter ammonificans TaxID=2916410 RepID=A0ABM9D6T3_9BACT|nr:nucleoside deaminase [Trichlorobacter ammonificans]CAH2030939.1 Cytosine/adenosine deaminase [Trichlorobacter ammonificans]